MPGTLLVVEDELDVLLLIRMALELGGYNVIEAGSAEQALDRLAVSEPDGMLLDIGLPGMDGWELLQQLNESGVVRRVPVIVVTAHAAPGGDAEAFRLGCRAYITKPFSPAALRATVDKALARDATA